MHTYALYSEKALTRCGVRGERKERPCKMETVGLLTRGVGEHALPHSLPIHLPDGEIELNRARKSGRKLMKTWTESTQVS